MVDRVERYYCYNQVLTTRLKQYSATLHYLSRGKNNAVSYLAFAVIS